MSESQKRFRPPPKKFQPRGLTILYEDRDIVVVDKVSGLLTIRNEQVRENTAYYLLNDYLRKGNLKARDRVFIVHRLDRDTSGVIVFAKTEEAKRYLQDEWPAFRKTYYAIVIGSPPKEQDVITSYLTENSAHKMYSIGDPKRGKLARTGYKIIRQSRGLSLLEIDLLTGRKNQIRAHLSEMGCPVLGDKKYGVKAKGVGKLALHAASLTLVHPHTKEQMTFAARIPSHFEMRPQTSGTRNAERGIRAPTVQGKRI